MSQGYANGGVPIGIGLTNTLATWSSSTVLSASGVSFTPSTYTFTGTLTGNTNLIFPTSGTLATTSQIPSFPISLANGGTGASLTASNGGIFYSNASTGAILAGTSTANQVLLSGASSAPSWSSATYPSTTTINQILYSSAANTITGLSTANNGVLITSSGGVPSIGSTLPAAVQSNITQVGTLSSLNVTGDVTAAGFTPGVTSTVSAAGTTTLTSTSNQTQILTGTTTQTYVLPNATTLVLGMTFNFNNNSTGLLTIQTNGGSTLTTVPAGGYLTVYLTANGTSAGTWDYQGLIPSNSAWGTGTLAAGGDITFVNTTNSGTIDLSNYWEKVIVNPLDHGVTFNGSTDDTTAWNNLMTSAADHTLFRLPSGTSVISGAITIPSGKHYVFWGAGAEKTFISTSSTTADTFTVGDWQTEFHQMSFSASVTKTAGNHVNYGSSNAQGYIDGCNFDGGWNGVTITGTLCNVNNCSFSNLINRCMVFNGTGVNTFVNECTMNSTSHTTANIEVLLCGSLLIANSDIIGGVNNLLIDPTSNGAFSIYSVNVFYDSATGSSVKIAGTSNTQRIKFTSCWMSGSVNGCELAGPTGSTSTTAVDFVNCDFYSNSANGLLATSFRDFTMIDCRVAGNTTAGVNISASAGSAVSSFIIANNTIGPTGQSTPGSSPNGTGILINSGTYLNYLIHHNNCVGNTTANITDNGVITGQGQKQIQANIGKALGPQFGQAAYAVTTTATYLNNPLVLPANSLTTSSLFRVTMIFSNVATASTTTILLKFGTAGTTADTTIATVTATGTAVADNAKVIFEINVTALSATVGATYVQSILEHQATATGFTNALAPILAGTSTATLNTTTGANYLGVVLSTTTASVVTLRSYYFEVINP